MKQYSFIHQGFTVVLYATSTLAAQKEYSKLKRFGWNNEVYKNKDFAQPDLYSVICCLTKYDPGDFNNFCGDMGYNEDSRQQAEKIYKAVCDEWANIQRLFNDEELELLQEIQ